jgi:hypothetical protein
VLCEIHIRPCCVDDFLLSHSGLLVELKEQLFSGGAGREQRLQVFLLVNLGLFLNELRPVIFPDNAPHALGLQKQKRHVEFVPTGSRLQFFFISEEGRKL